MWLVSRLLLLLEGLLGLATYYLLVLLAAATFRGPLRCHAGGARIHLRFLILIPAHDEERLIGDALASLQRLDYPKDCFEVIVIADNCQDRTATLAAAAGATVYERSHSSRRGKGYALAWALEQLLPERPAVEAVAILDADCRVSPNCLLAMEASLRSGAEAVQVQYVVANSDESWVSGLRFAAFALMNTVRPLGKSRLGLSSGLAGTGMAFSRRLLERHPWKAFSLVEDGEYHERLVAAGHRVVFCPEACVSSPMPTSLQQARAQHLRWESGKWELVRRWTLRLVWAGVRRKDPVRLHAGLELVVPPQSLLLAGNVTLGLLAAGLRLPIGVRLAVANVLGQFCFVIGGLALIRAPKEVYQALLLSPLLVVWKIRLYLALLVAGGPNHWTRTDRDPIAAKARARP